MGDEDGHFSIYRYNMNYARVSSLRKVKKLPSCMRHRIYRCKEFQIATKMQLTTVTIISWMKLKSNQSPNHKHFTCQPIDAFILGILRSIELQRLQIDHHTVSKGNCSHTNALKLQCCWRVLVNEK